MNLEVGVYKVLGIELGMVKIGDDFYCATNQLQKLFKESDRTIRQAMNRNSHRFSGTRLADLLRVTDCHPQEMKRALKAKQLRKDAVMWNSSDVLSMGLILCGDEARAFQADVIHMLKEQATFNMVPKEQLEAALMTNKQLADMKEALQEKLDRVEDRMTKMEDHLGIAASNAGRTLRLVRDTQPS